MSTRPVPTKDGDQKVAETNPKAAPIDMKFEIVVLPVSDVDRAKEFYAKLGWRLDADYAHENDFRVLQFTPPGSGCSVIFGKNVTPAAPGSAQGLYLIVSDLEAVRADLLRQDVGGQLLHAALALAHLVAGGVGEEAVRDARLVRRGALRRVEPVVPDRHDVAAIGQQVARVEADVAIGDRAQENAGNADQDDDDDHPAGAGQRCRATARIRSDD